ncbi:hypothetical protein PMALA_067100 [Plasmodium malariae]|uniref:Uncharacterized protein n=1 Tax=Plasmodium malariae TaxID=5858 RepID=A0A1A8X1D5_PLAMA|nr:hypothetical protein PMALA_067100 [Plasmodium malariae]
MAPNIKKDLKSHSNGESFNELAKDSKTTYDLPVLFIVGLTIIIILNKPYISPQPSVKSNMSDNDNNKKNSKGKAIPFFFMDDLWHPEIFDGFLRD